MLCSEDEWLWDLAQSNHRDLSWGFFHLGFFHLGLQHGGKAQQHCSP